MCSKRALKKLTTELKPAVIKLRVGTDLDDDDDDDALGDAHLHHLLLSLQSKAITAFERSCETMQLQTPLLPQVSVQVGLSTSPCCLMKSTPCVYRPWQAQLDSSMYSFPSTCDTRVTPSETVCLAFTCEPAKVTCRCPNMPCWTDPSCRRCQSFQIRTSAR